MRGHRGSVIACPRLPGLDRHWSAESRSTMALIPEPGRCVRVRGSATGDEPTLPRPTGIDFEPAQHLQRPSRLLCTHPRARGSTLKSQADQLVR